MKRLLSIVMTALMLLSCISVVSAAEPEMTERLAKVTSTVKKQLSIGDEYTSFHGQLQENGVDVYWNLSWEKENGSTLNINVSESGKIMGYTLNTVSEEKYSYDNYFAPSFPKITKEKAKQSAEAFLVMVLDKDTESFAFNEENQLSSPKSTDFYYLNGNIKLNALDSPIGASIRVSTIDSTVTSFSRNDLHTKYVGTLPDSTATVTQSAAEKLLYNTVKMKLEYTTDSHDRSNEKSNKAVLRYLPIYNGNYIVDAKTGELIDTDTLYKDLNRITNASGQKEAAADMNSGSKLSQVELDGIEKLKDVLNKDQLNSKIKGMTELGLADYTLSDARYRLDQETNTVFCNLNYGLLDSKNDTKTILHKNITINAKTGELISMYSSYTDSETKKVLETSEKQKQAEAFLEKYFSANYAKTKLYPQDTNYTINAIDTRMPLPQENLTYAQNEKGYFFPENAFQISINSETGFVDNFNMNFSEVTFDSDAGIISDQQAIDAYASNYETKLSYISVPKEIDLSAPEWQAYIKLGYTYLYELKLAYTPYFENKPYAVDAKTGKALYYSSKQTQKLFYDDDNTLEIKELAKYGIGYSGLSFQKDKELTQLDLIALLVSADGYLYTPEDGEDNLYMHAYNLGILKKSERDPKKSITRSELVKTILSMSGYGKTANLPGIYISKFSDEKEIKPEFYGFVAIAQGLGMIKANENGSFLPNKTATRGDIATMLYNFMLR